MELKVSSTDNLTLILFSNNSNDLNTNDTVNITSSANYDGFSVTQTILDFINLYYLGTIIVVGLLGNGRNVYLFLRNKKELRSPSYYLAALALADVVFLVTLLILWLTHFGIYVFNHSGFYDMLFYLSSTSSCISGRDFLYISLLFIFQSIALTYK
jgi:hypothetical protein